MKNNIKTHAFMAIAIFSFTHTDAQVLYAPGALLGVSTNANNVGVGTNAPAFKLTVQPTNYQPNDGIQVLQTNASSAALRLDNTYTGGHKWGILSTSDGNTQLGGKLLFYDYNTGGGERMVITGTGSVGIGTFNSGNPLERLHVHNGAIRITGANNNGGPMVLFGGVIDGTTSGAPSGQWGIEYVNNTSNPALCGLNFWRPNMAHNMTGAGAGMQNAVMFMRNDNHVGINTDNPTAQLTVNGNMLVGDPSAVTLPSGYKLYVQDGILAEKVKVAASSSIYWADYVFASDYKLSSLEAVAAYVKEHKHLPNVPSTSEVQENGLDMAEMDATLLRQIEEIWLHLIELKKENQLLKEQLTKKD